MTRRRGLREIAGGRPAMSTPPTSVSGPTVTRVRTVGEVSFSVATTTRPWELGVDALVISVGDTLGGLGEAVRKPLPELPWKELSYRSVGPDAPRSLPTKRTPPDP